MTATSSHAHGPDSDGGGSATISIDPSRCRLRAALAAVRAERGVSDASGPGSAPTAVRTAACNALRAAGDFYDYHAKYVASDTEYLCPAPLPAAKVVPAG